MTKAIQTKFIGPTNHKPSRVKAYDLDGNQVTLSWDHALDAYGNHLEAASALVTKMGWTMYLAGGATEQGYAFVDISHIARQLG